MINKKIKSLIALGLSAATLLSFSAINCFACAPSGPSEEPLPCPYVDEETELYRGTLSREIAYIFLDSLDHAYLQNDAMRKFCTQKIFQKIINDGINPFFISSGSELERNLFAHLNEEFASYTLPQ